VDSFSTYDNPYSADYHCVASQPPVDWFDSMALTNVRIICLVADEDSRLFTYTSSLAGVSGSVFDFTLSKWILYDPEYEPQHEPEPGTVTRGLGDRMTDPGLLV
jgi:hypothetical protein